MKTQIHLSLLILTMGLAVISPNATGQTGAPEAGEPASAGAPQIAAGTDRSDPTETPQTVSATTAIPVFSSPPGKLRQVVDFLQHEIQTFNQPRLNIVYAPGVEGTSVPQLELYTVYGPDALLLIAAAAECVAKPIYGPETDKLNGQRIIGYRLQKENKPAGGSSTMIPGMAASAATGAEGSMMGGALVPSAATTDPFAGKSVVGFGGLGMGGMPGPGVGLIEGGLQMPGVVGSTPGALGGEQVGELRVYALGALNKSLPKEKVVETITALLQDEEAVRAGVKVKFHDNTNVLVVRGPADTHRLVTELIEALERNASTGAYTSEVQVPQPIVKPSPVRR